MAHAADLDALLLRAKRACDDLATVRDEVAITRAETRQLLASAHQASVADFRNVRDNSAPPIVEAPDAEIDPHALALEVLRMMRELLNGFPIEWQVSIVKALTARTMLIVAAQMHTPPLTPAA